LPETRDNQQGQTGTATLEPEQHQTQAATGSPQAAGTSQSGAATAGASTAGRQAGTGATSGAQTGRGPLSGGPAGGAAGIQTGMGTTSSGAASSPGLTRRGMMTPASVLGDPFGMMRSMMDQMDRVFNDFLGLSPFGRTRPQGPGASLQNLTGGAGTGMANLWYPQIEVSERGGNLVVCADLPGMKKEDVHLDIHDDYLVLEGERRQQQEQNEGGWYRSERSYGRFYRTVPLPEGADLDQARASFRDGVLEVTIPLPQREEQQPRGRRIEIQ
jgi:HSP20 family protein